ncbi:hypothetical protein AC1031_007157 [Aphanomyces cochlioides]|nr:hypothetical protein AC1031_007157 [Aphanomyces cochlioides]
MSDKTVVDKSIFDHCPFGDAEYGSRIAIETPLHHVSFRELAADMKCLQETLQQAGVAIVAVSLPFGTVQIAALCSAIVSRIAFVPIDETQSIERNEWMLQDAYAQGLICLKDSQLLDNIQKTKDNITIANLDVQGGACFVTWKLAPSLPPLLKDPDAMYVLYTSGSSGHPKGVVGSFRATSNRIKWMWHAFPFKAVDKVLRSTKLTFVDSLWEILGALWHGQTLVIVGPPTFTPPLIGDLDKVVAVIEAHGVTRMTVVPSLLQMLLQTRVPSSIQFVLVSGEIFHVQLLRRAMRWAPQATFINLYGSTEVSGDVTFDAFSLSAVTSDQLGQMNKHGVPIGVPVDGASIKLVQVEDMSPRQELWVSGAPLALGYLNRQGDNIAKFTELEGKRWFKTGDECFWRENKLYYRGRTDSQVKISGVSIHLDAVERIFHTWLSKHFASSSHQWHVGAIGVSTTKQWLQLDTLVVYVGIHTASVVLGADETKQMLQFLFSSHAIVPTRVIVIDIHAFPMTSSGKRDRNALESMCSGQSVSSVSPVVDPVHHLVHEFLNVNQIEGDFEKNTLVDLGGNSLALTMILYAIRDRFKISLTLSDMYEKTIAQLRDLLPSKKRSIGSSTMENTLQKKSRITGDIQYELQVEWTVSMQKCIDATPLAVQRATETWIVIGSHDHFVICVDAAPPSRTLWRTQLPDRIESSCARHDNNVYVGCYDGYIYCLHLMTGEIRWSFLTQDQVKCSPLVVPEKGVVVCGSHDHSVYALDLDSGCCIFRIPFEGSVFATPAVRLSLDFLFCASTAGELQAHEWSSLAQNNNNSKWRIKLDVPVFSNLVVSEDLLLVGCADGFLYGISFEGRIAWKASTSKPIFSSPCIVQSLKNPIVIFGSHDGLLRCADLKTGLILASINLGSAIFASPAIVKSSASGILCAACTVQGVLYLWDTKDSTWQARLDLKADIFSSPVVHDNSLYIGTRSNQLHRIKIKSNKQVAL